jgi:hypothetical protein
MWASENRMQIRRFLPVLIVAAAAGSGCSQVLAPYGARYRPYPAARPYVPAPPDPERAARGRWDSVMRLPGGTVIDVLSMNGETFVGAFGGADGSSVRVMVNGMEESIPRAEVLRVDLVDLPGSETGAVVKRAGLGAALGVGAAALVAGVIGGHAWPPPGALLRGGAAIGGVAGAEAALAARQGRLIYLAEHQASVPYAATPDDRVSARMPPRVARVLAADDWLAIAQLPDGTLVRVTRSGGWRHQGVLTGVDEQSMRVDIDGAELRITRASIVRVEVLQ